LVEAGTRFVTVYWGSEDQDWADGRGLRSANNPWDTHRNHFPLTKDSLCPRADQAFSTLLEDLAERELLESTLVVWMGDFGRTPTISKPWASRDHWPHAFTILLAGAGVRAGSIYGTTDERAAEVIDGPVSPADLTATILHTLGIDPHLTISTASGAAHRLSPGHVIDEWFT
jgi:arylsulfatase A-like enzyme